MASSSLGRSIPRLFLHPFPRSTLGICLAAGEPAPLSRHLTVAYGSHATALIGRRWQGGFRSRDLKIRSPDQTDKNANKIQRRTFVAHENIYTIPNLLTLTRLAAAPLIGFLVLQDASGWAVGILACAAVTDMLDGWIARRLNQRTIVGTVIDPLADKALMTILTICLAMKGALPIWLAVIILGRDLGLGFAAIYYRWVSLPPPRTFARYWNFSLPSAEVRPTMISKCNTCLQLTLVGVTTATPLINVDLTTSLNILQWVVASTTIWSGVSYIYNKDAVKIIR